MYTMPTSCAHKYQQRVHGTGLASASIDLVHPQRRHSIPPCRVLHRLPALASGPGGADEATFDLHYELCSLHYEPCNHTISTTAISPDSSQYDGVAITVSMQGIAITVSMRVLPESPFPSAGEFIMRGWRLRSLSPPLLLHATQLTKLLQSSPQ